MLTATTSLAARIERAEAGTAAAFGRRAADRGADLLVHPIGGTVAVLLLRPSAKPVSGERGDGLYHVAGSWWPLALILTEDPVPLAERRPDLPAELTAAVHRALSREPSERFPDVRAFRQALLPLGQ